MGRKPKPCEKCGKEKPKNQKLCVACWLEENEPEIYQKYKKWCKKWKKKKTQDMD